MGVIQSTEFTNPTNEIPISTCTSLFLDEKFADFHFAIDSNGEKILVPAHKLLLAKGSPVFDAMFYGGFNEENAITITDTSLDELKEFLQFFYLQEPTLTFENVPKVMELLDKYLLSGCLEICEKFLFKYFLHFDLEDVTRKMNDLNDICVIHQLAFTYNLDKLKQFCLTIMHHSSDIFSTDSFRQSSKEFLTYILDTDSLSYAPSQMLDACINWAKRKCEDNDLEPTKMDNLRKQLGDCLYYIQFGLMTHKQFLQCIVKYEGLLNHEELQEIFLIMSDDSFALKKFKRKPLKEWNDDEALRSKNPERTLKILSYVNQAEILSFRTNQILLLGAIGIPKILSENRFWSLNATITIINRISHGGESSAETNVLLEQFQQFLASDEYEDEIRQIKLSKPIICHPGVLYEIQILFDSSFESNKCTYYGIKFFELLYNGGVKVGIERTSIVSDLYFNLLFEPMALDVNWNK